MARRFLIICILILVSQGCALLPGCDGASPADPCTRILFIGNSYTYVNDLPGTFAQLAGAGGHRVQTGMAAQGGWTLAQHAGSAATLNQLTQSAWNDVVLQEQSQIPAVEPARSAEMYPAARQLVAMIRKAGATPIFFLTWGHRHGWPENGLPDYGSMQAQLDNGYLAIAHELGAPVAPVGLAWWTASRQAAPPDLWQADGSHPTAQGTYLAACVFYALVFRQSPEGLAYLDDLPADTAHALQSMAAHTVLDNPGQWNLP